MFPPPWENAPTSHDDAAGRLDAWKLLPADTACKSGL
jgi:hypothetical protein